MTSPQLRRPGSFHELCTELTAAAFPDASPMTTASYALEAVAAVGHAQNRRLPLQASPELPGADLRLVDLTGLTLSRANLAGADLTGADLTGADLTRAILSDVNLTDAVLYDADLTGANLTGANLHGADLGSADLHGANLTGANLAGADLGSADLTGADLTRANLYVADLTGADLYVADLTGANLYGADLTGANLYGADLTDADLTRAKLTDADLHGVNLHGTEPAQGFWTVLADEERAALADLGRLTVYPPGAVLIVEGDPSTDVFVLVNGWVKIVVAASDGQELTLALRGHGDAVGEIAGETTGYRTATVRALGTVRALIVPYEKFSAFLDTHSGADHAYRRMVMRRWTEAESRLRQRAVTNGTQRLAGLLLELAGHRDSKGGTPIALTQEELANLTGASRATVTRALSNWRRRGIIRTGQRDITIIDLAALRKISGKQPRMHGKPGA